jgi:hypothetical protein
MIYDIPHVTQFGSMWSILRIQWEVVHLPPQRKDGNGGSVFLGAFMLEYIQAMNTPQAWQWMVGAAGTIVWGVLDKKHPDSKLNKRARMPVIAIGGNKIEVVDGSISKGYGIVVGMKHADYNITPQTHPQYWHRIWCITKQRKSISAPHDTPRGIAYLPILDVSYFRRTKALAEGITYIEVK